MDAYLRRRGMTLFRIAIFALAAMALLACNDFEVEDRIADQRLACVRDRPHCSWGHRCSVPEDPWECEADLRVGQGGSSPAPSRGYTISER